MKINIKPQTLTLIGYLLLVWGFFFLLGGVAAVNAPFLLVLIGTVLYLLSIVAQA